ncbi:MAG: PEP-CTERM-box response regulator transcription factor [Syntrophaceae bacterium]
MKSEMIKEEMKKTEVELVKPKLLVVDDDEDLRTQMKWAFMQDYDVLLAEDRKTALEHYRKERPAVVTLDLGLPPEPAGVEEGFNTLSDILGENHMAKIIIITGRAEKEHAIRAVEQGAYDIFFKPIVVDELGIVIKRAFHVADLERERLVRQPDEGTFEGMIGSCPRMQEIYSIIRKVAKSDASVLITGESGTGKELVAKAIHNLSYRMKGQCIVINCGAIPESLLEAELFGHEKGAYTGAHVQRKGRIEYAHKGTLLLDEIGDMPLPLQVKLLRFLQDQTLERIGGREQIVVDARVLASTNRDLKSAVQAGSFREDLFFRLGIIHIELPALRERGGDITLLAKSFLRRFAKEGKKRITGFTSQAVLAMEHYEWPGNVRELEHRIKRAVIMAEGSKVKPEDMELSFSNPAIVDITLKEARENLEREMVQKALDRHQGNLTKAAAELGVSRPSLYDLMEKTGITKAK